MKEPLWSQSKHKILSLLALSSAFVCALIPKGSKVGSHPSCTGQPEVEKISSVSLPGDIDWYLGEDQGANILHNGKVLTFSQIKKLTLSLEWL